MKNISLYQCEVCGAQYKFSEDAKACERFHVSPRCHNTILSARYQPYHEEGASKYPSSITVIMDDGGHITYKR